MNPSDAEFEFHLDRVKAIIGSCRKVLLVFAAITVMLLVLGAWAASRALSSLSSYIARRKAFPTSDVFPSSEDPAPGPTLQQKREDTEQAREQENLRNILATLQAQAQACGGTAPSSGRDPGDAMDERIFVREHDDFVSG